MSCTRMMWVLWLAVFIVRVPCRAASELSPARDAALHSPSSLQLEEAGQPLCGHPSQDIDYDADVDFVDYAQFSACMAEPSGLSCPCFDTDADTDVDLGDFVRFQIVFGWTVRQPANPSFEHAGGYGNAFAGWYQHGDVSVSETMAMHGAASAKVTGLSSSDWDLSGVWQRLAADPGDRWSASVWVGHSCTHPLSGATRAILNVEWHGRDGLIRYDSFIVADAATTCGGMAAIAPIAVGPAPEDTESLHLLLGVVQGPDDPPAEVFFDLVEFHPSDFDARQWEEFAGGRSLDFAGRSWRVKGPGPYAPGPNYYCDSEERVWVDCADGRLHLTVSSNGLDGKWCSTEVALSEPLGYGDYIVTTVGSLADAWDANMVLGLFLYQYVAYWEPANFWWNPPNESDVEYSRWGDPNELKTGQFAVQPYDFPSHRERFEITRGEEDLTSHAFRWLPDRVEFRVWRGGPDDEAPETLIHAWTYTGPNLPRPEQPRMHINFWHLGDSPWSWTNYEVVIAEFRFVGVGQTPPVIVNSR